MTERTDGDVGDATSWLEAHRRLIHRKLAGECNQDAEAVAAIHDVLVAYAVLYDAGDIEGLLDLFSESGTYTSYLGTFTGRRELRQNFAELVQHFDRAAHHVTNITVCLTSDTTAEAAGYVSAVVTTDTGVAYSFTGSYDDRLVKVDGRWKIDRRIVRDGIAYDVDRIPLSSRLETRED